MFRTLKCKILYLRGKKRMEGCSQVRKLKQCRLGTQALISISEEAARCSKRISLSQDDLHSVIVLAKPGAV
jgi:hypothetical protein